MQAAGWTCQELTGTLRVKGLCHSVPSFPSMNGTNMLERTASHRLTEAFATNLSKKQIRQLPVAPWLHQRMAHGRESQLERPLLLATTSCVVFANTVPSVLWSCHHLGAQHLLHAPQLCIASTTRAAAASDATGTKSCMDDISVVRKLRHKPRCWMSSASYSNTSWLAHLRHKI